MAKHLNFVDLKKIFDWLDKPANRAEMKFLHVAAIIDKMFADTAVRPSIGAMRKILKQHGVEYGQRSPLSQTRNMRDKASAQALLARTLRTIIDQLELAIPRTDREDLDTLVARGNIDKT
jgi:hypothetical protein